MERGSGVGVPPRDGDVVTEGEGGVGGEETGEGGGGGGDGRGGEGVGGGGRVGSGRGGDQAEEMGEGFYGVHMGEGGGKR